MVRRKKKDEDIIEKLIKKADEAKRTGLELSKIVSEQAQIHGKRLKKEGSKKIDKGISVAKKIASSREDDLNTLERLAKLRKSGTLTEKEFREKKKQILARL